MESRFSRFVSVFLILSLLTPALANATDSVAHQEPAIAPLAQGKPAPWPGVLLNAAAVGSISFDYDHENDKINAAVQKAISDITTQKSGELDSLKAAFNSNLVQKDALIEEKDANILVLNKENKILRDEVSNTPSTITWFGFGVASGIVLIVLTAFAIGQAVK